MSSCYRPQTVLRIGLALASLGVAAAAFAYSQPPPPGPPHRDQPAQEQAQPQEAKPAPGGRLTDPSAITKLREFQEARPRQDAAKSSGNSPEWWTVRLSLATFGATFVIAIATWLTYSVYRNILATNRQIERAYIKMSHLSPGLDIPSIIMTSSARPVPRRDVSVRMSVRNHGNTPGEVTCGLVQLLFTDEPLPHRPAYDEKEARPARVFLVKGSSFKITKNWPIDADTIDRVCAGAMQMYVLGYVDYLDRFGGRHRAGYARIYNSRADRGNNLPYVTEPGYNYDRIRQQDEGCDWEDRRS
jgi:hypothetical protein